MYGRHLDKEATVAAVVFDIDGTICSYPRSHGEVLDLAFERAGVEPFFPVEAYIERFETTVDDCDSIDDLRERIFRSLAREDGREPEVGSDIAREFAAVRDPRDVQPAPGLGAVIDTLDDRYRIGAVTNAPAETQLLKLDALGISEAFEIVICAGFDSAAKPDPEPFTVALDRLETDPEAAVYVGDSLETDVAGAQAVGMQTAWLGERRPTRGMQPDFVLDSLDSLLAEPWN